MSEGHLNPARAELIVNDGGITPHELNHVKLCSFCNGWLRAFAAVAVAAGKKLNFELPAEPRRFS
jgi:hypothetical protein